MGITCLRNLVGDKAFRNAVKDYLTINAFKNANTNTFLNSVKFTSKDLTNFEEQWLYSSVLPYTQMAKSH